MYRDRAAVETRCKSRNSGAFVHTIALVDSTEAREGCFSKKLLPSSIVSNAIVPIVKEALATAMDASRYPII